MSGGKAHPALSDGMEQFYRYKFAWRQYLLAVVRHIFHRVIYPAKQFGDNIYSSYGVEPLLRMLSTHGMAHSRGIFNSVSN